MKRKTIQLKIEFFELVFGLLTLITSMGVEATALPKLAMKLDLWNKQKQFDFFIYVGCMMYSHEMIGYMVSKRFKQM